MTKACTVVLLMSITLIGFSQCYIRLEPLAGKQSDKRPSAWPYFANFSPAQKKLIKDHWKQFFKADINKDLDPTIPMFPIKFDSYGALYPDQNFFTEFKESDFNPSKWSPKNLLAFSLFDIFFYGRKPLIDSAIERQTDGSVKKFYAELQTTGFDELKAFDPQLEAFYTKWHNFHFERKIAELKNAIRSSSSKKVLFFIHGYNVPYSLAVVQAIELHKLIRRQGINTDEILLVPIFWPSNNAKECMLDNEETFSTNNEKSFKNGFTSTYYSNRAYFAAAGLRKLINGLQSEKVNVYMFSHSLGATTLTTSLIDTYSKLQLKWKKLEPANDARTFLAKNEKKLDPVTAEILTRLTDNIPVPTMPIHSFMSAPAIPGVDTFKDMDRKLMANKKFYVAINRNDEMLNKRFAIKLRPRKHGSTTLGMDDDGQACDTQDMFTGELKGNFIVREVSNKEDHDILIYMLQPEFGRFVAQFLNDN